MLQGGMVWSDTRERIDLAHGRASLYVTSDMGAIESGRWHASHFSWKIGATSLENVGAFAGAVGAPATVALANIAPPATNDRKCFMIVLPI